MPEERYEIRKIGEKKTAVIHCRGCPYGASIADSPRCMACVLNILREADVDQIILSELYEKVYDEKQTRLLKEIANLANRFEELGIWGTSYLIDPQVGGHEYLSQRHATVLKIVHDLWLTDPIQAYIALLRTITKEEEKSKRDPEYARVTKRYLQTLYKIKEMMELTELIRRAKKLIKEMGSLPKDRGIYHAFFEPQIKPAFIGSRLIFGLEEELELVDQYMVGETEVKIFAHPERVTHIYYISPPEYFLPPEQYFILIKAKEVVAEYRPEKIAASMFSRSRKYFERMYEVTIRDLAKTYKIKLSPEDVRNLAKIVARYTVGYGILEILLSDRRLTDIYIDAPLGMRPIYVVHRDYGICETNVLFTEEEAKTIVTKLRALSGRPFDESHPVLDYNLEDMNARVAVIGPPLSPDGIAFAFRLHKPTPWTLPQFIDVKMVNPLAAGLLSFFVDSQTSILIAGSRGAGKTSLLTSLMLEIPQNTRILVQEDTLELPVMAMKELGFNIQRLKTRSPIGPQEGTGEVSPEEALRTALRLGESVLIVGEVRSTEAKVLYEAMRVGAIGNVVMGTIHGESAYSVWDRVVNDLGVPSTSFKATDLVVVCAPIRFKGSLRKHRRVIEVTEIKKHWREDPYEEGGLLDLMRYSADVDELRLVEENLKESELFAKIERLTGRKIDEIWQEIEARGKSKQFLVDLKRKYDVPEILEAKYTVPAHSKFLLFMEKQRREYGGLVLDELFQEWGEWVRQNLLKPLLRKRGK